MTDMTDMTNTRRIAMVAHDNKKVDLLAWAEFNVDTLAITSSTPPGPPGPCSSTSWD